MSASVFEFPAHQFRWLATIRPPLSELVELEADDLQAHLKKVFFFKYFFLIIGLRVQSTVFPSQILNASQIASIIVAADQKLLLFDPRLLLIDVAQKLMDRDGFVQLFPAFICCFL